MPAPASTYRLQLRPGFGFDEAAALVGYLADLGVSHVYCSPYLQAAPGSTHGYDVVDHSRVNVELGGDDAHRRLCAALGEAGLGQVLDIVPNHMAITAENEWWWDVLENGQASRYAAYFDVDWDPPESKLRDTVLLPVLGDHYGRVLERGEITLVRHGGCFEIHYFDHRFPVGPRSLDPLLAMAAASSGSDDLAFVAASYGGLPPATATDQTAAAVRHRDKQVLRRQLARLLDEQPNVAAAVDEVVAQVNADPDLLDALLERQSYRLALWRTAGRELDYRRFFDIASLAALRMEDPQVFADTHRLVLAWLEAGVLDGLRVDHPDGLLDPGGYARRLRDAAPDAWLVVEKILHAGERLPDSWAVDGTTGYDFLNVVTGAFVDPAGEAPLTDAYRRFTGMHEEWQEVAYGARHELMREALAADVNRLTHLFVQVCEASRRYRDFTRHELHEVLREVIACFPVYRTYVTPWGDRTDDDDAHLDTALAEAARRRPDLDSELFELLGRVLRGRLDSPPAVQLLLRFQQTTGPVMAKGVEDTSFYRFNRLLALNEVGGDPAVFGLGLQEVHAHLADRHERLPRSMLSSSTHDTKRSEDVRARLCVLSEVPERLAAAVERWSAAAERHRSGDVPDRNLEWLIWQTLVGAWPLPVDRAVGYVEKAMREAKVHTSWTDQQPDYEAGVVRFVEGVVGDDAITDDVAGFVDEIRDHGWVTSLAAQLVKLAAPGVPDVYQGTELWDLSLVDPDNRRPVDFELRRKRLAELDGLSAEEVWCRRDDGLPKLLVTAAALRLRRRRPEAFGPGERGRYGPASVAGAAADHTLAFSRGDAVAVVVPRLVVGLAAGGGFGDTVVTLPGRGWRNVLTGDEVEGAADRTVVSVAELLSRFPVALLEREEAS